MTKEKQKQKVSEFIVRGEEIGKKEKTEYIGVSQIKGPEYEAWMSEINVFNERNLKEHPLYSDIHSSFFHRNTDRRSYQNMMGLLQALLNDEEYWGESTFLLNETSLINSEEARNKTDMAPIIFISHRTTDRAIADILLDFFIATGISREKIFCSSLPGNDVRERISVEVKEALQNSCLNIAILSDDYYKSAYCLNEAGILWFEKTPVIPIALPEINHENMIGFLNDDYKIRRLDNADDLAYIYDTVCEESASSQSKASVVTAESQKLIAKYQQLISARPQVQVAEQPGIFDVTTDDEKIVLYYMISKQVRKVSKSVMLDWIQDKEISGVNVDNAFDLLSTIGTGKFEDDTLELGIEAFRELTATSSDLIKQLQLVVCAHTALSSDRFKKLWDEKEIDNDTKLFIAYIIDERIDHFGSRWMAEGQTEDIKNWEAKYSLDSTLSSNYGKCLSFFIQNNFVFESDWTSYGNPREYRLCTSLKELLFNHSDCFSIQLQSIKDLHHYDLPF